MFAGFAQMTNLQAQTRWEVRSHIAWFAALRFAIVKAPFSYTANNIAWLRPFVSHTTHVQLHTLRGPSQNCTATTSVLFVFKRKAKFWIGIESTRVSISCN